MAKRKFGFINTSGQWVVEPIFDSALDFHEGLAAVKFADKWGYIDKYGYVAIEPKYDEVSAVFAEGLAWVKEREKFYYIDKSGRKVLGPIPTAEGYSFHEGFAVVGGMGINGYIDRSGKLAIEANYVRTFNFNNGIAIVKKYRPDPTVSYLWPGEWGYIDTHGRFTSLNIDDIAGTEDNYIRIIRGKKHQGGKFGLLDRSGTIIIEPEFDYIDFFHEGLARANRNGKRGFIDKTGDFVIEVQEPGMFVRGFGNFSGGLAPVKSGAKWGYIDKTGQFVIEPQYDYADQFFSGYACVKNGDKYGVIDKSGRLLFEPEYIKDDWCHFSEGYAVVTNNNKYGYIDITRHTVIAPQYDEGYEFYEGLARVGVDWNIDAQAEFQKLPRRTRPQNTTSSTPRSTLQNTSSHKKSAMPKKQSSGCYIATAVYGSYDCPEVWTLRRYRDNVLDNSWYGRLFIRCYYAVSPTLVKWFGKTNWFRNLFRKPLNRWVNKLNEQGVENIPYTDKY